MVQVLSSHGSLVQVPWPGRSSRLFWQEPIIHNQYITMCGATDVYERDTYIIVQLNNVIIAMMVKEILQLTKLSIRIIIRKRSKS